MENNWLTPKLKQEVRLIFEPKYHRKLMDKEIVDIAENLSELIGIILKFQWKKKYGKESKTIPKSMGAPSTRSKIV